MNALEEAPAVRTTEDTAEGVPTELSSEERATVDVSQQRKSILDRFGEKLKEFLDNA